MKKNITTQCYIEQDGKYLMLYRNKKENDANEGKWIGIGGHLEDGETVEACMLREVKEETNLSLTSWKFHGTVDFHSDQWPDETLWVYTSDAFAGKVDMNCNEGTLHWIEKEKIMDLNIWEGDRVFLKLILEDAPFFHLELNYEGDKLASHRLDFPEDYDLQEHTVGNMEEKGKNIL